MSNSKQQNPFEKENYPISSEIIYYGDQKFTSVVIQEDTYPPTSRASRSHTIQCSINYAEEKPHYLICFGDNLQYQVISAQSPFDASVELHKKTAVSGVYLFRLQLKCIDRYRKDCVVLRTLDFTIENKEYHVTFEDDDTVESILLREYAISQTRQEINACMGELIPINFIDLNSTIVQEELLEESDITDLLIIEQVVSTIGKGTYRNVKKILEYITLSYIKKGVLDPAILTIHLQISGDRWNIGQKVKYVMITIALLDNSMNLFKSDCHYTTVLFPGTENYPTLKVAVNALIQELQELRDDKLRVLQNFNLAKLFDPERAALIKIYTSNYWYNAFQVLYEISQNPDTGNEKINDFIQKRQLKSDNYNDIQKAIVKKMSCYKPTILTLTAPATPASEIEEDNDIIHPKHAGDCLPNSV
ncbi:hypothetical protein C1646_819576 [Rhizophagus diaphanus]|nr:hypothetical protein C1646_819576 [Rhizophagus diaphanus] [Rhizophagus sp. MUCL 43196]